MRRLPPTAYTLPAVVVQPRPQRGCVIEATLVHVRVSMSKYSTVWRNSRLPLLPPMTKISSSSPY